MIGLVVVVVMKLVEVGVSCGVEDIGEGSNSSEELGGLSLSGPHCQQSQLKIDMAEWSVVERV